MNEVSKTQLVVSLILVTIGFGLWLIPGDVGIMYSAFLFQIDAWITTSRDEHASLSRPLRGIHFLWIALVLLGFLAIGLAEHYWASNAFDRSVDRVMHHPTLVGSLWIVSIWLKCRKWNHANQNAQAASS